MVDSNACSDCGAESGCTADKSVLLTFCRAALHMLWWATCVGPALQLTWADVMVVLLLRAVLCHAIICCYQGA